MTEEKLRQLLSEMSLEEKVGQTVQLPGQSYDALAQMTGLAQQTEGAEPSLWLAGSTLGIYGAEKVRKLQDQYMEHQPHQIPLMFMLDVIHGYETAFPCPLGLGAAFDPAGAEAAARAAARECSAGGVQVTFSPMADLARDARWGRVMESTGEDPYLNGLMAAAMVEGFQGDKLTEPGSIASCLKHFTAYGAAAAGLDYSNVELSEHTMRQYYLPAYKEAVAAGCELVMTSFNSWNGLPTSGNPWLLQQVLRKEMGFEGVVISDWGAVGEMIAHGICEDERAAAKLAIETGVDIDMCSGCYAHTLADLVRSGEVAQETLDAAVWRILVLKNKLGLFENPYKDANEQQEALLALCREHRELARKLVCQSLVLLKNEGGENRLLPLDKKKKTAFIGPYIDDVDLRSSWVISGSPEGTVSVRQAAQEALGDNCLFAKGCTLLDNHTLLNAARYDCENWKEENQVLLEEALAAAAQADTVVLCLGEHRGQSGEATSRTRITLPEVQLKLAEAIAKVNPSVVTVIFSGRPLELDQVCALSKAVVEAWLPGTEGGHGVLDVLTGAYNPTGKLSMSFPYNVGQEPISYNSYSSGRPRPAEGLGQYTTRYLDAPNEPLFVFGHGLSYTEFTVGKPVLSQDVLSAEGPGLQVSASVRNTGSMDGAVTMQLYLQDVTASCVRPVKELKGIRSVSLKSGEEKTVSFMITEEMLRFYRADGTYGSEPGRFRVWIAQSSRVEEPAEFRLTESPI